MLVLFWRRSLVLLFPVAKFRQKAKLRIKISPQKSDFLRLSVARSEEEEKGQNSYIWFPLHSQTY
jgi:hypothetical protein